MKAKIMRIIAAAVLITAFAGAGLISAKSHEGGKDCMKMKSGEMKDNMHEYCACMVKGAEVSVENTKDGVTVKITSKDADTVREIQKKAGKMGSCMKGKKEIKMKKQDEKK